MTESQSALHPRAYLLAAGEPNEEQKVIDLAVKQIEDRNLRIADIVGWIGPYVTQIDDLVQNAKGKLVEYFAHIISAVDLNLPPRQDVDMVASWFISRVEHWTAPGLKESIAALTALSKTSKSRFTDERAATSLNAIFGNTEKFSEVPAATRLAVYNYIALLEENRPKAISSITGEPFLRQINALGAREKDPRNLMVWFSIMKRLLETTDITEYRDEVWDNVSQYFPISLKREHQINITAEDLKTKLRGCIAANSAFAKLALPFLTAKLDSEVTANVKWDVIRTMHACVESYDSASVEDWSSTILDTLKYEVLNVVEESLADDSLKVLSTVGRRLSFEIIAENLDGSPLMRYVHAVVKDFNGYLSDGRQKFVPQSGRILTTVAASSDLAFNMVLKQVMPRLRTVYEDTNGVEERNALMVIVLDLLRGKRTLVKLAFKDGKIADRKQVYGGGLDEYTDKLMELFERLVLEEDLGAKSLKLTGLHGLLELTQLPELLTEAATGMCISQICSILINMTESRNEVLDETIAALKCIARTHPELTEQVVIPQLTSKLPSTIDDADIERYGVIIEAMATVASQNNFYDKSNDMLLKLFHDAFPANDSQAYPRLILAGLLRSMNLRQVAGLSTREQDVIAFKSLIEKLYKGVLQVGSSHEQSLGALEYIDLRGAWTPDDATLDLIGKIAMTAIRWMTADEQRWASTQAFTLFTLKGSDEETNEELLKQATQNQISALCMGITHKNLFTLVMYLLAGLHPEAVVLFDPKNLCSRLMTVLLDPITIHHDGGSDSAPSSSQTSGNEKNIISKYVSDSLLDIVALLINKWSTTLPAKNVPDTKKNTAVSNQAEETHFVSPLNILRSNLSNIQEMIPVQALRTVKLGLICAMAANLKGATTVAAELMRTLVDCLRLRSRSFSHAFAERFQLLVMPSEILSKQNHAIIRGLSSTRPFGICVPQISTLYEETRKSADTEESHRIRESCLIALISIIRYTPHEAVMDAVSDLFPKILLCLITTATGPGGQETAIDTISYTFEERPEVVEGHALSVVKALISCIEDTHNVSPLVRAKSLILLGKLISSGKLRATFESLKRNVSSILDSAVADPVRSVRKEAVNARSLWITRVMANAES